MFGWLKRMRRKALGSSDRADRNAVIRRIVAAAADESRNRTGTSESTVRPVGTGSGTISHEPPRFTQDGQPITPLPAGKPSAAATTPLPEGSRLTPVPISRPTPTPMASILEASGPPLEGEIPREKIAQRAMEIWVRKGRPVGTSDSDWVQAEAELRAELLYMPAESPSMITRKPR